MNRLSNGVMVCAGLCRCVDRSFFHAGTDCTVNDFRFCRNRLC